MNFQYYLFIEFKSQYEPSIYDRGPLKGPPRHFYIKKTIYGDVKNEGGDGRLCLVKIIKVS
jgi:hypothetical protein